MNRLASILLLTFIFSLNFPLQTSAQDNPWSVSASWDVIEQDITFESAGIKLAGTLFSPKSIQNGPAVVVVQQTGSKKRDDPYSMQIAKSFNAIGFSVFLYDRRGQGESKGDSTRPRYQTLAEDAVAGKQAIADTDAVHAKKIGYWGISQGGWLAMEAANISDPAFVISVSSPLTTPGEQMEFLAYNYILLRHGKEAARQALKARRAVMDDFFRGKKSHKSARSILAEIQDEPWFELTFMPSSDELPETVEETSWIHEMDYNPVPAYQDVEAPLLFILGGEDIDIPVKRTLEIREGLDEPSHSELVVIPGANHSMRIGDDPSEEYDMEDSPFLANSEKYFMIMGEFIGRLNLHGE